MGHFKTTIGVLALQGCVERHRPHVEAAGALFMTVKTLDDFEAVDAFILPGGESTTMLKLIERFNLWDVLVSEFAAKPVWGVCAGSILMAETVTNPAQKSFGLMPVSIERNGYGRQLQSHTDMIEDYEVSFIRAPVVRDVRNNVKIRAVHDGDPVWLEHGQYMMTTFHPELTMDYPSPMHQAFLNIVQEFYAKNTRLSA